MSTQSINANWMSDQIIYEIFPDRFAIGHPHSSTTKLALPLYDATRHHQGKVQDYVTRSWDQMPIIPSLGKDFFGGDLDGIVDHLDYLKTLGITALFLTPIFFAPSNHKYDTTDFFQVEQQFGGKKSLQRLIAELQNRNMRLIMDVAFNHMSDIHSWFQKAKNNISPFKDFFSFESDGKYRSWRNHWEMPELNLSNLSLQNLLFRDSDSVLQMYLDLGIDGWRFDSAADLGSDIVHQICQLIRNKFPKAVLIGETTHFGANWIGEEMFHGVMNYYFRSALLGWISGTLSTNQFKVASNDYYQSYGMPGALCSWNMLSSHDTPRLKHILRRGWQRYLAVVAQFTFPGVPIVYYGEEIGMEGGEDPDCRRPMIWDKSRWDKDSENFFRQMISIRKSRRELRNGKFLLLETKPSDNTIAFLRFTEAPHEVALIVLNNSSTPMKERLMVPHSHLYDGLWMENLLLPNTPYVTFSQGYIDLALPAQTAAIYCPNDTQYSHYNFYKQRNTGSMPFPVELVINSDVR